MLEASHRDPLTKRAKITSVIFAVPRHVHSHISRRTTSELYGFAKTTVVIMSVALPTVIGFVIVMQAMLHTPVLITPISVPDSIRRADIRAKRRPNASWTRSRTSTKYRWEASRRQT